jgi:hypothetical protein
MWSTTRGFVAYVTGCDASGKGRTHERFQGTSYRDSLITLNSLPQIISIREPLRHNMYRGADKSLARPGRKQATATEDFDVHISYLYW